jgi:hypothetical protein
MSKNNPKPMKANNVNLPNVNLNKTMKVNMNKNKNIRASFTERLNNYVCRNNTAYTDEQVDKPAVITEIIELYKKYAEEILGEKDEELNWINNDLLTLVGFKIDLQQQKNKEGMNLWNELDGKMMIDGKPNLERIKSVLAELSLPLLLSFLGYAHYKNFINKREPLKIKRGFFDWFRDRM